MKGRYGKEAAVFIASAALFLMVLALMVCLVHHQTVDLGQIPPSQGITTGVLFYTGQGVICVEEAAADGFQDAFPKYTRGEHQCLIGDGRMP